MSGISIQDVLTPQTPTQVRTTLVNALKTLGIPADQWVPGGTFSLILTVVATIYAQITTLIAQAVGSGFLETASGNWLTLLAFYVYGVTRPPATFASGQITLTNSAGGSYSYLAGQVTFFDPVNKQTYTNTGPLTLGALSSVTVPIACTTAGQIGSAPPGEITGLQTQMLGVTVSNAASVVGSDALDDPGLRTLCLNRLGALSVRGPRNAYAFAVQVALNAVTGAPVNINRMSISRSSHTGIVTIVVAAPSGVPDANDVAGVVTSIESGVPGLFSGVRPDCVTANVSGATAVPYTQGLTVWALTTPGVAASDVQASVATAIVDYIETYPVGGVTTDAGTGLWGSGIVAAAKSGSPAPIVEVEASGGGAVPDLPLGAGQVATDNVTVTVRMVNLS